MGTDSGHGNVAACSSTHYATPGLNLRSAAPPCSGGEPSTQGGGGGQPAPPALTFSRQACSSGSV
jgi:hypothetical protein